MKYLLHIDTSADTGTIAVSGDGKLICEQINSESRNHASNINIMIQDVLLSAGISLKDLSGVVVCAGPGSYTGLRIGLSTAKGICYALDIPLFMDNKLVLLAHQAFTNTNKKYDNYISLLIAREKEYFIAIFDKNFINTFPAKHIIESELDNLLSNKENIYLIGNSLPEPLAQKVSENNNMTSDVKIDLAIWSLFAFDEFNCNKSVNLSTAEPFYLKQVYTHK